MTVYIQVNDLDESLGGWQVMDPAPVGDLRDVAMFTDPDSNPIYLFAPTGRPAP